jgi:hypothetical protein
MATSPLSPIPQYGEPILKAEEKQSKSEYGLMDIIDTLINSCITLLEFIDPLQPGCVGHYMCTRRVHVRRTRIPK